MVLAHVSGGQSAATLHTVRKPGRPLVVGGKPAIVFVSEESCPFCAAERWSLAVALSLRHLDPPRHHPLLGH